jgi:hypothetical protein
LRPGRPPVTCAAGEIAYSAHTLGARDHLKEHRPTPRGVARNQRRLSLRVAAINLRRLVNLGLTHDHTATGWVLAEQQ